jgi:hypothetical protein
MRYIPIVVLLLVVTPARAVPQWFRNAEVYNGWYTAWNEKVVKEKMTGIPLVVGCPPDRKIVEAAHRQGTRVITYITLYQMPLDQVYEDSKLGDHPDWIVINARGEQAKSVFWSSDNPGWYETCANNAGFRKAMLAYIRKILATGIDGLFIDNAHPPAQCYGEKLGKHKHIFPGEDHLRPWQDFIREVVRTVKAKNPENIVILNPGEPGNDLRGLADGIMIESYICTWASKVRWHNWDRISQWAKDWGDGPDQIVTLSYIGHTSAPPREDAFYCYACARLSGFLWADWYSKFDSYKDLFAVRLGEPTGKMQQQGPIYYRMFDRGIVAVNPGADPASLVLPVKGCDYVTDQFNGIRLKLSESTLRVELPAASGRVYRLPFH